MNYVIILEFIIERGKKRTKKKGDYLHRHRIVPGYKGGSYNEENISYLTKKEHKLVHKIRYKLYQQNQDYFAELVLSKNYNEAYKKWHREISRKGGLTNVRTGHCARIARLGGLAQGPKNKEQLRELNKKIMKQVNVAGIVYESQSAAGRKYDITAASVSDRIKSKHFPDWNLA